MELRHNHHQCRSPALVRGYRLPGNARTTAPSRLVFVDCETVARSVKSSKTTSAHSLLLGCASTLRLERRRETRRSQLTFTKHQEFWTWLDTVMEPRKTTWLWCHNAAFDCSIIQLWHQLELHPEWYRWAVLETHPFIVRLSVRGKPLFIVDTFNWFPMSLAKLGDKIGLKKLPMPVAHADADEWERYCRRDVEIIERAVVRLCKWWRENDFGNFKATVAGAAMQAYRHRFRQCDIHFHDRKEVHELERAAYIGGRHECFFRGKVHGPVYHLDVTSLYPSVMRSNLFPVKLIKRCVPKNLKELRELTKQYAIVAEVQIVTESPEYPQKTDKDNLYPVGQFWTTLPGPELEHALYHDHVGQVMECALYERGEIFTRFVDAMWENRIGAELAGDDLYALICKQMMTFLYGKFGQKSPQWVDTDERSPVPRWERWASIDAQSHQVREYRGIGHITQVAGPEGETKFSFPAIAAYVTSYGRLRMNELCHIAGWPEVLHIATDAIHVLPPGFLSLTDAGQIRTREMGYLRLIDTWPEVQYTAANHYVAGGKRIAAGLPLRAKETSLGLLTWDEFESVDGVLTRPPDGTVLTTTRTVDPASQRLNGRLTKRGRILPVRLGPERR